MITTRAGEEALLAREAVREGYDVVAAAGGDGTWSAVADQILRAGRPGVALGILPGGTGNDFGRNLGIGGEDLEAAVRVLAGGRLTRVDAGRIVGESRHEERDDAFLEGRHFLNVVGFGFDVGVVVGAQGARFLRGALLYKATALGQLFRFPGFEVLIEDDQGPPLEGPALMLTVTNGRYFGGGFPIAPAGRLQDGLLHACHIRDARPLRRLLLFHQAGKGRHESSPEVTPRQARRFRMVFPAPVRFEIDGDLYLSGDRVVEVEVLADILPVLAPSR